MELPDFFGLDIGDHSVKFAEVKRKGSNSADLLKLGSGDIPFSIFDSDSEEGYEQLGLRLREIKKELGIQTPNCVAAIPESPIFSRLLTIPKVEEDKIEETVHWELKPLIPVPIEEVDIAFLEVAEVEKAGQKFVDIYAVASPKKIVEKYQMICEKAGFNLIALETESLANTRVVSFNKGVENSAMVVDFGSHGTDVILSRDGVPVFAQTIGTGSDALTKAISSDYGINETQAEQYKKAYGLKFELGEGKIAKSLDPIMQIITGEMTRTLTYLQQRIGQSQQGTKMFLVGEGSQLPGLQEYLKEKLQLDSELVDPVAKMSVSKDAKSKLDQIGSAGFSVALGLGLKDS